MMTFLSSEEKQQISDTIQKVESRTRGELVTVIARSSDEYLYIPLLWAALLALVVPAFVILTGIEIDTGDLYIAQVICFAVALIVFRLPPVVMRLIPKSVKYRRARRLAQEQFFLQGLHHTQERTGVLLFVSIAEHYVEIIADKGVNDVVPTGTWNNIVERFIADVKERRICDGFVTAIESCGEVLEEHFPAESANPNELADHLVELH